MGGEPLCPSPKVWRLGLIAWLYDRIIIHLEARRQSVPCPQCGVKSSRVHSRYRRRASDLPWSSWPVQLVVHTRKFFGDNLQCLRRIFTETFPGVLVPYARRTQRLGQVLLELVHSSNAESAARVGGFLGYPTSPDTLLRCQRQEQIPTPTPRVMRVDEFALRRGCTYATILVDLERHRPVDILEGKQSAPLTEWLRDHPGVDILTRDRAEAYALAGRTGAPAALQVADRFHLVHNVGEALKKLLRSQRWIVPEPESGAGVILPDPTLVTERAPQVNVPKPTPRKQALWEAVHRQKSSGYSNGAIARELGINRKTVRKYLATDHPPTNAPRLRRSTRLTPYLPYLRQRWEEGCHNARQLHRELVIRGYQGAETRVRDVVHPWRTKHSPSVRRRRSTAALHWLVLKPLNQLSDADRQELLSFLEANPQLARGHQLKESFRQIVAQGDLEGLDGWREQAASSGLRPFQSLAWGFGKDYQAIQLALTTRWSNAQCEGQICRVKLIKRLGYGRAKLDLLRHRILHRRVAI